MSHWVSVRDDTARNFERELARELPSGHVLKGLSVQVVARREDRDDVEFRLDDGRLCVVHLTWSVEDDPRWPHVDFVEELPDADDNE